MLKREIEDGVVKIVQFPILQFSIQEMILNLDQEFINEILRFVNNLSSLFKTSEDILYTGDEHKTEILPKYMWEIIPEVRAQAPYQPDSSLIDADKLYIRMLHLAALKLDITLDFEKQVSI